MFCLQLKAQYVTIPDANFAAYLQSIIPSAMNGNQMNTSSPLVATTTHTINVQSKNVANLYGIQYFSSLTHLNCDTNLLTSLPTLPNSLTYLSCGYNSLTNIPTLPNSLSYLSSDSNSLTSLPTLPNSLLELGCSHNSLTGLPALPNALIHLYCDYNSLTSLPALPNSLKYIFCGYNSLVSLPSLPDSLYTLFCYENSLTSLPYLPSTLTWFQCQHNNLTSMPPIPNSLFEFFCGYNNITCFPTFPDSIPSFHIDPNPYNCLPNHIPSMDSIPLATPLCTTGNSNGCVVAGIEYYANNVQASIYPIPANNSFTIELNTSNKQTLQLFDVNGKLVLSQTINGKANIDASNLAEGVYNLSLINPSGVANKRLVIVR